MSARAGAAELAATAGVFSHAGLVDLYAEIAQEGETGSAEYGVARDLRTAYTDSDVNDRVRAIRTLWDEAKTPRTQYARLILTARAASWIPASAEITEPEKLIASMLSAGLDRNAMGWARVVPEGSAAWGLLALAQPVRNGTIDGSAVGNYVDQDSSSGQRKSQFLVAGLAGLGRLELSTANSIEKSLGTGLGRESPWSRMIDQAAAANNPALVAMLAGLGMQGDSWSMMTPRQLYLIVRSLNRVGLSAEARMIAAEAVARG